MTWIIRVQNYVDYAINTMSIEIVCSKTHFLCFLYTPVCLFSMRLPLILASPITIKYERVLNFALICILHCSIDCHSQLKQFQIVNIVNLENRKIITLKNHPLASQPETDKQMVFTTPSFLNKLCRSHIAALTKTVRPSKLSDVVSP